MKKINSAVAATCIVVFLFTGCNTAEQPNAEKESKPVPTETPEFFLLRTEEEKTYGYSHAVKIGNDIKISGAVSMDDKGNLTAPGTRNNK